MQRSGVRSLLDMIGISLMTRDIQVLGALLKLHVEQSAGRTVDDIRQKVNFELKKKYSKAWIYKCLSNLEKEGFIVVNRIDTPNTYSAGLGSIGSTVQKHINEELLELVAEEKEIEEDIQFLSLQSTDALAETLIESITGHQVGKTTRVVQGLQNVRRVIIRELTEDVGEGDILRTNERWNLIDFNGIQSDIVVSRILKAIENGLEVRAILGELPFSKRFGRGTMKAFIHAEEAALTKGILSGKLKIRVVKDATHSYRMLSLNREKMLLFLSDASKPDSVALVTRDASPKLIDYSVDAFDKVWDSAEDIAKEYAVNFNEHGVTE